MKIEAAMGSVAFEGTGSAVQTLESRLLAASQTPPETRRPDPAFEHLYQRLLAMEGQGEKAIYAFLRAQRGADGQSPAYPSAKALMAVAMQVLVRLKDEKLEKSLIYKEVSAANTLAFSVDLFVTRFMGEVFQPMGDDAWEKSEW